MAENLRYKSTGDDFCYRDEYINCSTIGRHYTWHTANGGEEASNTNPSGIRGVCPIHAVVAGIDMSHDA